MARDGDEELKKKIVLVDWVDSCTNSGWHKPEDVKQRGISSCSSVGYLVKKNREELTIVQNISHGSEQIGEAMSIPRRCVKKITFL